MRYVIPTQFALHIASNLEKRGAKLIYPLKNRDNSFYHPDGTFYTRIPEAEGLDGDVLVLHSGAPNPNRGNVELDFILSILKRNKANFSVFMLYAPFRQDHICEPGETIYAQDLIESILWRGAKKIYAIDAHSVGQEWMSKYPIENISADGLFTDVRDKYPDAVWLTPDVGAGKRFGTAISMDKVRHDSYKVQIKSPDKLRKTVRRRTVVVRDDIISTGGTMIQARKKLLELGARKVVAVATHGVGWYGLESVYMEYDGKLFVTNTVKNRFANNIDVTPLVERALA